MSQNLPRGRNQGPLRSKGPCGRPGSAERGLATTPDASTGRRGRRHWPLAHFPPHVRAPRRAGGMAASSTMVGSMGRWQPTGQQESSTWVTDTPGTPGASELTSGRELAKVRYIVLFCGSRAPGTGVAEPPRVKFLGCTEEWCCPHTGQPPRAGLLEHGHPVL